MLTATDIAKTYARDRVSVPVLRGLSLTVRAGEFLSVVGASGSGKSTMLHLLGGLDTPNQGHILSDGVNLASLSNLALSRWRNQKVGFIFQAYHLLPELDALENVCLPARLARISVDTAVERGRELLRRVGLADRMDHKPFELSGGEQQRVAIARSLINSPELLLADEPTGNLDSHTGEAIIDLLCGLRDEHQTTLIVATHDAKVAARAPRVLELADGLVCGGTTKN